MGTIQEGLPHTEKDQAEPVEQKCNMIEDQSTELSRQVLQLIHF